MIRWHVPLSLQFLFTLQMFLKALLILVFIYICSYKPIDWFRRVNVKVLLSFVTLLSDDLISDMHLLFHLLFRLVLWQEMLRILRDWNKLCVLLLFNRPGKTPSWKMHIFVYKNYFDFNLWLSKIYLVQFFGVLGFWGFEVWFGVCE